MENVDKKQKDIQDLLYYQFSHDDVEKVSEIQYIAGFLELFYFVCIIYMYILYL